MTGKWLRDGNATPPPYIDDHTSQTHLKARDVTGIDLRRQRKVACTCILFRGTYRDLSTSDFLSVIFFLPVVMTVVFIRRGVGCERERGMCVKDAVAVTVWVYEDPSLR